MTKGRLICIWITNYKYINTILKPDKLLSQWSLFVVLVGTCVFSSSWIIPPITSTRWYRLSSDYFTGTWPWTFEMGFIWRINELNSALVCVYSTDYLTICKWTECVLQQLITVWFGLHVDDSNVQLKRLWHSFE
jgi:hypothetical protein